MTDHYYRCGPVFDRVTAWPKKHGVSARKPLYALRRLINAKYDLVTAKELLRHSSVAIGKRGRTGPGAVLLKRMRKDKGKKTGELSSNNGNSIHHLQKLNQGAKILWAVLEWVRNFVSLPPSGRQPASESATGTAAVSVQKREASFAA